MTMTAREEILARVRRALADVPRDEAEAAPPATASTEVRADGDLPEHGQPSAATPTDVRPDGYLLEHGQHSEAELIDLLAENLADYRAHVHRGTESELAAIVARLLTDHGSTSVATPTALPESWLTELPSDITRVADSAELTANRLDEVDAVVTACALAIAETGTIVLDAGPGQGRRMLTLVPDHHICVIRVPEQLVASVPRALVRLDPARPLTWIAGPSATSDIELDRVEGVHGPRMLDVILVSPDSTSP